MKVSLNYFLCLVVFFHSINFSFAMTDSAPSKNKIFISKYLEIYKANRKFPRKLIRKTLMKNSGKEIDFFDSKISEYKISEFPEVEFFENGFKLKVNTKIQEFKLLDVSEQRVLLNNEELEFNKMSTLHKKLNKIISLLERKNSDKGAFIDLFFKTIIPESQANVGVLIVAGLTILAVYVATEISGYTNPPHGNLWDSVKRLEGLESVELRDCNALKGTGILNLKIDTTNSSGQRVIQDISYDFKSVSAADSKEIPNYYEKNVKCNFINPDKRTKDYFKSLLDKSGVPHKHQNVVFSKDNYGYKMIFEEDPKSPPNGLHFPNLFTPTTSSPLESKNKYKIISNENPDWEIFNAAYDCCKEGTECQNSFNALAKTQTSQIRPSTTGNSSKSNLIQTQGAK